MWQGGDCGERGLIPAHAGKTRISVTRRRRIRADPHSRGENQIHRVTSAILTGSSPLTRGKHEENGVSGHRRGLIPAHAGKTAAIAWQVSTARVHPHARGENANTYPRFDVDAGSSPLTRGKRHDQRRVGAPRGLIPAHAGKTTAASHSARGAGAHPRSREENWFFRPSHL